MVLSNRHGAYPARHRIATSIERREPLSNQGGTDADGGLAGSTAPMLSIAQRRSTILAAGRIIGYGRTAHAEICATCFLASLLTAALTTPAAGAANRRHQSRRAHLQDVGEPRSDHRLAPERALQFLARCAARRRITSAISAGSASISASAAAASWSGPWWRRPTAITTARSPAHYVGVNADASLGLGAGAKVLVGGSHRSIALQPLSVSGQVGVNLALGVAGLTLRSAP